MSDNNGTHKNEPCPCGSGHKYKKCCMESDQAKVKLKNSFRDEVAKVPEAEQLRRDQRVLLSQLQFQADVHARDKGHLGDDGTAAMIKEQIARLNAMPSTEGTENIINNLMQQLKGIDAAINQSAPTWAQGVYLKTLEQVLNQETRNWYPPESMIGAGQSLSKVDQLVEEVLEESKTAPIIPSVANKLSSPKLGPIQTDEDDDLDDD